MTGYAALDEIVAVYHVSRSYAYRLACQHHWGRYRHPDGTTRYRREDVDETLAPGASRRLLAQRSLRGVKSTD